MKKIDPQLKKQVFEFLDRLRESGQINMFGAGPVVQSEFGFDKREARSLVMEWMGGFGKE